MTINERPVGFPCGTRVRLVAEIEYYPLGIWPVGTTGTVTQNTPGQHPSGVVRLDEHFPSLDDWDNQLQVSSPLEDDRATWANWEPLL